MKYEAKCADFHEHTVRVVAAIVAIDTATALSYYLLICV